MKKSLISKIALAIVLVSASTQAFGIGIKDVKKFFKKPLVKSTVVNIATYVPATYIPVMLAFLQQADGHNLSATMLAVDCGIGAGIAFASRTLAEKYPAGYVTAVALTFATIFISNAL